MKEKKKKNAAILELDKKQKTILNYAHLKNMNAYYVIKI